MNDNHAVEPGIRLSAALADQLSTISGTQLKVYVHLCAAWHGEFFSATIEQIGTATGLRRRSVIGAVKALSEKNLVVRLVGKGGKANRYGISFDAPRQAAITSRAPQDEALRGPSAETVNTIGEAEGEHALAASVAGLDEMLTNITQRLFSCILQQGAANSGQCLPIGSADTAMTPEQRAA